MKRNVTKRNGGIAVYFIAVSKINKIKKLDLPLLTVYYIAVNIKFTKVSGYIRAAVFFLC